MFCRDLTNVYDEVRVISGPLFLVEEDNMTGKSLVKYEVGTATGAFTTLSSLGWSKLKQISLSLQVIGKSHVAVPTHLYKIVLAESKSSPTAMGEKINCTDLTSLPSHHLFPVC